MEKLKKIIATLALGILVIIPAGCGKKGIPDNLREKVNMYFEFWNTGQFENIESVVTRDFTRIESPHFEPRTGIEYLKKLVANTRVTYPDFRLTIEEIIYEKNKAAIIWRVTGTQNGPGEIPPTGRTINSKGMSVMYFLDGKISEEWLSNNNLLLLMQLGYTLTPPPVGKETEQKP
ncbi:MAG: ester cyclase [Bacteroidales bacterium]|jgi:predicted ester cyclase|nr:ester cyclase [Bacteroidales bacterium]